MKIAILLPGHLRTFSKCKQNFMDNVLNGDHQFDIFVATYYNIDCRGGNVLTMDEINELLKDLNVKKLVITNDDKLKITDESQGDHSPQYRIIKRVNNLKSQYEQENNFKYDLVVKTRFDLIVNNKIDYDKIDKGVLTISNIGWGQPCDLLAIGTSENMDIYCNRFKNAKCPHGSLENLKLPLNKMIKGNIIRCDWDNRFFNII